MGPVLILMGLVCGVMVLTHWLAVWLVLGLVLGVAFFLAGGRAGAILVAAFPFIALSGWGWWQMQLCGDPLGGVKALLQAQIAATNVDVVMRDLSPGLPTVVLDDLLRRVGLNLQEQFTSLLGYLGTCVVALFFFAALLHAFRRPDAASARWTLAVVFGSVLCGMGLVGLPGKLLDDNALYVVVMPAMTVFGATMLVVMWSRLKTGHTFWAGWGGPLVAILLTALLMAVNLPVYLKFGLTLGSKMLPHWPPYLPDRASQLKLLIDADEFLISDAPAFVGWYGDATCMALPVQRDDFAAFQSAVQSRKAKIAGFVMTPVSAQCDRLSDIFTGPYADWRDLIVPGPMMAFEKDFAPSPDLPYKVIHPIMSPSEF